MHSNVFKESAYSINKATKFLKEGGLVAIKTETVYGLACDPSNLESIEKVYNLKRRPLYNPLIIHVSSIEMANKIAKVNQLAKKVAEEFWPGPITLILPKRKNKLIEDFSISGLNTVAVRIPNSKVFLKTIKKFKKPIAAPSANISGYITSTNANHVLDSFGKKIDLIIDSGKSLFGLESTILDLTTQIPIIRRQGIITEDEIAKKIGIKIKVFDQLFNGELPVSPGQTSKHYSPHTPLKINSKKPQSGDALLNYGKNYINNFEPSLNLSSKGDLYEAAHNLFDYLRKLDKLKKKRIVVAPIPKKGIGKTINERLTRAIIK